MKLILFVLSICSLCLVSCAGVQSRYHEVSAGESLGAIAKSYGVPAAQLQKYNSDALALGLHPGVKLYIPFERSPEWQAEFSEEPSRNVAQSQQEEEKPVAELNRVHFSWPLFGYVSSGFGRRHHKDHEGIDIPARRGTPVHASRSGHVIYAGNRIRGYGNMVIVRHADSFSSVYAHLSKIDVKKGQFVSRGQAVGRVGQTGHAHGYHLHFEIRDNRVAVNPLFYLQGQYANNIVGR
jgi:murein DD-endopeptidase MepM/ murein hydrolase activator NlpD